MKVSFTTLGCPDWGIDQIIENGKAFGYDGVELRVREDGRHFSPESSLDEARATGQKFRDGGIPTMSMMGYSTFAHTDPAQVEENVKLLDRLVDLAEAFEAPYVRTFAGKIPEGADRAAMIEQIGLAIKSVAAKAADKGITIGLETHDDWCAGDTVMKVVSVIDSKGFGVVYDIFNAFHSGIEPWRVTYDKVKDHICYCHVKDGYTGMDGKSIYVLTGAGDLPVNDIVAAFKADGFDSFFSFEWEKMWHPELEEPERSLPHFAHKIRAIWNAV